MALRSAPAAMSQPVHNAAMPSGIKLLLLFSVLYSLLLLLVCGVICSSLLALTHPFSSCVVACCLLGLVPALFLFKRDGSKSYHGLLCYRLYGWKSILLNIFCMWIVPQLRAPIKIPSQKNGFFFLPFHASMFYSHLISSVSTCSSTCM